MSKNKLNPLLFILPLMVFIGIVVMLFGRLGEDTQVAVSTSVDKPLPAFSLPSLTDESITVSNADMPKQPYLVNVWGTWCIACSREHPILMKMKEQNVNIVGINYKDERDYALKYLEEEGNPFSINVYDEDGELGVELGLTGAPETFLVDAEGVIRQHIVGEITVDNWQARIQPCLTAVKNGGSADELALICQ